MAQGAVAGTNIYRITIFMRWQQQLLQTGWHMRDTGLVALQSPDTALDLVQPWVHDHFRTIMHQNLVFERIAAEEITSKNYAERVLVAEAGTVNGVEAPSFMAVNVALRSAQRHRYRNGRMFWPLTGQLANTGSQLSAGPGAEIQGVVTSWVTTFLGNILTNNFRAVVVAPARPATAKRPAIDHSWIDVDVAKLNTTITALRRRKVGVGS